jgi:phosphate transport system protein
VDEWHCLRAVQTAYRHEADKFFSATTGTAVREVYQAELRALVEGALVLARMVETALGRVGSALLDADCAQAKSVRETLEPVERLHAELDARAVDLIARQQPVARDLRTIVAVLRMNVDLERMGVLTRHLAEIAQARQPRCAVPDALREHVQRMSHVACRLTAEACAVIEAADDAATAEGMDAEDDEMDRLQVEVYERLLAAVNGFEPGEAMDMALIARYYERLADHAVSLARLMSFRAGRAPLDPLPASAD